MIGPVSASLHRLAGRALATAQNGLEVVRFGGLRTETSAAPFRVEETRSMFRLRRYFPDQCHGGPQVILVPPMMVSANVYDINTEQGAVTILHDAGIDPWVVDFGSPDHEVGGMERTLTDHVVAVSDAVDIVIEATGVPAVHLGGYSQGGMFVYQVAALRRSAGIAGIVTFGAPVDVLAGLPLGLPAGLVVPMARLLADNVFNRLWITGWMAKTGFQLLDPIKTVQSRIDFLRQLHDRDALLAREDQRRFLEREGWVAYSGPAVAELLRQFVAHNRMVSGGFTVGDRMVTLAEITSPVLAFLGDADDIGQPVAVRGVVRAAPRAQVYESVLPTGHFGLVVGSTAKSQTWPRAAAWINWLSSDGDKPTDIQPMVEIPDDERGQSGISIPARVVHGVGTLTEVAAGLAAETAGGAVVLRDTGRAVAAEAVRTLPRLFRLGSLQPSTRISLGRLMSDAAHRRPDEELLVFADRVLTHRQVNERVDNVVAGLIACGIRPGQHVGLLMEPRPSGMVALAALSRLGAVGVVLAPVRDLAQMLQMTDCTAVIVDPEHLAEVTEHSERVLVLGGGSRAGHGNPAGPAANGSSASGSRSPIRAHVVDMEQIDPQSVELPQWYRPDPQRADELAFILFTRRNGLLERWPISNYRWAFSAYGSASAASLNVHDTILSFGPLHHAAGLLTILGAALVGGSRIAMSSEPTGRRMSEEVHRYGVTVVSYTWSVLEDVIRSPELTLDAHSPIRLFMGSGLPTGLWEEIADRFPRARVLEFFATSDGSVMIGNVSGTKIGSMGKPLPETNAVRIAAFDADSERLLTDAYGFVREARADETGLMLARPRVASPGATALRNAFSRGDTWVSTGVLAARDVDGDLWYRGNTASVIRSCDGVVFPQPMIDALSSSPVIGRVAVYGYGPAGSELAVAVVTPRRADGQSAAGWPTVAALRTALAALQSSQRPHIVWAVDEIDLTESYRPTAERFRMAGLPRPGQRAWYRGADGRYRRLTRAVAVERGRLMPQERPAADGRPQVAPTHR